MGFDVTNDYSVANHVGPVSSNLADPRVEAWDVLVAPAWPYRPILCTANLGGGLYLYEFLVVDGIDARTECNDFRDDLVYANHGLLYGPWFLLSNYPLLGSFQRFPGITNPVTPESI